MAEGQAERKGPLRWLKDKLEARRQNREKRALVRKMVAGELPLPDIEKLLGVKDAEQGKEEGTVEEEKIPEPAINPAEKIIKISKNDQGYFESKFIETESEDRLRVGHSIRAANLEFKLEGFTDGFDGPEAILSMSSRNGAPYLDSYGNPVWVRVNTDSPTQLIFTGCTCEISGKDLDSGSDLFEITIRITPKEPGMEYDDDLFSYVGPADGSMLFKGPLSDRDYFRKVLRTAKCICKGKRPIDLTKEDLNRIVEQLGDENQYNRAAALYLIGRRKAREYLDDVISLANDESNLVKSFAYLALYKFRDMDTIKEMIRKLACPKMTMESVLLKIRDLRPENYQLFLDVAEDVTSEDWFMEEKEKDSDVYKLTSSLISDLLSSQHENRDQESNRMMLWWMDPNLRVPFRQRIRNADRVMAGYISAYVPPHNPDIEAVLNRPPRDVTDLDVYMIERRWRTFLRRTMVNPSEYADVQVRRSDESMSQDLRDMANPFSSMHSEEIRKLARKEFIRSLSRKERKEIEELEGKKLKDMTYEELDEVFSNLGRERKLIQELKQAKKRENAMKNVFPMRGMVNRIIYCPCCRTPNFRGAANCSQCNATIRTL